MMAEDRSPEDGTEHPMGEMEHRVRAALDAGAAAGGRAGDTVGLGDLDRRVRARARRRQRRAGLVAAMAVVVAALGGLVVGRGDGGSGPGRSEVVDVALGDGRPGVTGAGPVDLPLAAPPGGAGAGGMLGAGDGDIDEAGGARSAAPYLPYSPWSHGWEADEPMGPVLTRTLEDGTVLDVRANRYPAGWWYGSDVPFWDPAPWCHPTGSLYVGVRAPDSVGQAGGQRYDALAPGTLSFSASVVGIPEGAPRWVVLVQVPPEVTQVRATFPGGGDDAVAPLEGTAVLSGRVADGYDPFPATGDEPPLALEGADAAGAPVASYRGPVHGYYGYGTLAGPDGRPVEPWSDPACTPPTELPAPGTEQPADPDGARAAITEAWERLNDRTTPVEEQAALVDDATGLVEAAQRLEESGLVDSVGPVSLPITDLVFADAGTAWFQFSIELSYGTFSTDQFGEARLVDGTWRISRTTICGLWAMGGGTCD